MKGSPAQLDLFLGRPEPRPQADLFRSLSPEELARVPRLTSEEIQAALERGWGARSARARRLGGVFPNSGLFLR